MNQSSELTDLTAIQLAVLMRERHVSPSEVVEAHLRRAEQLNPHLNAVVTFAPDVLERARDREQEIMRGTQMGCLHGVPLTIKDTIETFGLRTTSGSRLRSSFIPQQDAPAVALLRRAGAIILGKTNASEMAIPYECDNPVFGRTNNPYNLARTSGGSSGGCAAAVAARLVPAGIGSDLSGSIRVPAHFCGIAGFKPASGIVPSAGHLPPTTGAFARGASLGPLARSVEDLALLFAALSDSGNARTKTETRAWQTWQETGEIDLRGCRFSLWRADERVAPVTEETEQALERAAQILCEAGLVMTDEPPPGVARAITLWFDLFAGHAGRFVREMYAGREIEAGAAVHSALGAENLPDNHEGARRECDALREVLIKWMTRTPLIIAPTGSAPAFAHSARHLRVKGAQTSVFRAFGYARAFNALDFPVITIPIACSNEHLPIGVQLVARPGDEARLFAAAHLLETAIGSWPPPLLPLSPLSSAPVSSQKS